MRPLNPVVPAVAKAYQDDPRYALAQAMMANGSTMAPTGSGSPWEGLARVAQALGGAYTQKKLGEHYQQEQEAYKKDTQDKTRQILDALAGPQPGQASLTGPQMAPGGFEQPPTPVQPPPVSPDLQGAPPGPQGAPPAMGAPQAPPQPQAGPVALPGGPQTASAGAVPPSVNPGRPGMPDLGKADPSIRLALARAMLGSDNNYSFSQGLQDLPAGLDDNARNVAAQREREYQAKMTGYKSDLDNFGNAESDSRRNYYDEQSGNRLFSHQRDLQHDSQAFQHTENELGRNATIQQADIDRALKFYNDYVEHFGHAPPGGPQGALKIVTGQGGSNLDSMIAITMQSESNGQEYRPDGSRTTSPKGARGIMQVMPSTAAKPGFGIKASDGSPQEDARVGRELLHAMMGKYDGDPAKAWAAYNWGSGRVDAAIRARGGNWMQALPAETRQYVAKNMTALNSGTNSYTGQVDAPGQGEKSLAERTLEMYQGWGGKNKDNTVGATGGSPNMFGNGGKALPQKAMDRLGNFTDLYQTLHALHDGYKGEYSVPGPNILGNAENAYNSKFGSGVGADRANWWGQYQQFVDDVRHAKFGAALTGNEKAEFEKEIFRVGDSQAKAQSFLKRWLQRAQQNLTREGKSLGAQGYNSQGIYEKIGADNASRLGDYGYLGGSNLSATGNVPMGPVMNIPGVGRVRKNAKGEWETAS